MKKLIFTLLIIHISINCYSQSGWFTQNSGTNQDFRGVYFVNSQTGWTLGFINTIKKTTNGDTDLLPQNSGTTESCWTAYLVD